MICTMPDCGKKHMARGYCMTHYSRWRRHGDPRIALRARLSGSDSGTWKGDAITYSGAHMRVRKVRGDARQFQCPCGRPAAQWAYRHDDPKEMDSELGAYSADPARYDALCVSCHKRSDLARKAIAVTYTEATR